MNFKTTPVSIQGKSFSELDNATEEYPTLDDLMREQHIVNKKDITVHHRRDLDSLG